jgi:hypothetical protein
MKPTEQRFRLLVMAGLIVMAVGIFLPVETSHGSSLIRSALFSFNRFKGKNGLTDGLYLNSLGVFPLIIVIAMAYAIAYREELGGMCFIAAVYLGLIFYDVILYGDNGKMGFGWLFLFGGLGMMIGALVWQWWVGRPRAPLTPDSPPPLSDQEVFSSPPAE